MMERVFICHVLPKNLITKYRVSQAGNNFSYNLIEGGVFDKIYSLIQTDIVEKINPNLFEKSIEAVQIRIFPHKRILKFLNILFENLTLFKKIKSNSNVWFYNLTVHTFILFILLKFFRRTVNVYVIVLDYTPSTKWFSLQSFIKKIINNSNGIISLSPIDSFKNSNAQCIAGVVNENNNNEKLTTLNKNFLYSGIINSKRNIKSILDTFSKNSEFTLHITGIAEDELLIKEYSEAYYNIKYHGYVSYNKYLEILSECSFCLNTRNPDIVEYKYNFPSKIIEYLMYNRIVISTINYEQISDLNYIVSSCNEEDLKLLFDEIVKNPEFFLTKYANQSHLIYNKFCTRTWISEMYKIERNKCN